VRAIDPMTRHLRVASDVGGTFTDLVWFAVDPATGTAGPVQVAKADTTPPDFEQGVLDTIAKAGIDLTEVAFLAHGSTVVINALTERKGARTGLVTTAGFRDVLEIARGNRPDLFNFNFRKPPPFVERHLRREVRERTNVAGRGRPRAGAGGPRRDRRSFPGARHRGGRGLLPPRLCQCRQRAHRRGAAARADARGGDRRQPRDQPRMARI
jgi:hypothetical protein